MRYSPNLLTDERYKKFQERISKYHDNITAFADITDLREVGKSNDDIADITSESFDTRVWPIRLDPETKDDEGPFWETTTERWAAKRIISNLMSGPDFGYRDFRIQPDEAKAIWETFLNFFDKDSIQLEEAQGPITGV